MSDNEKTTAKYIAPIEEAELICRMIEAGAAIRRPKGATAEQALNTIDEVDKVIWRKAARAAMDYWRECINTANLVN